MPLIHNNTSMDDPLCLGVLVARVLFKMLPAVPDHRAITYNPFMPRVLHTAFDIVPSPKGHPHIFCITFVGSSIVEWRSIS